MNALLSRFSLHRLSVAVTLILALPACDHDSKYHNRSERAAPTEPAGSPEPSPQAPVEVLQLAGVVRNYHTGEVIPAAQIRLSAATDQGFTAFSEATTSTAGAFSIDRPASESALLLEVTAPGYARGVVTIPAGSAAQAGELIPQLQPLATQVRGSTSTPLTASYTRMLSSGEATAPLLNVPAASLVNLDGNSFEGDYTVGLAVIDPSSDPALMPGNFEAVDTATGTISQIETFGAIELDITSGAGEALGFAGGSVATLNIPIASSIDPESAPDSVALFYFDTALGYWVERGVAQLKTFDKSQVYQAPIDKPGIWSASLPFNAVTLSGCVVNTEGQPLEKVRFMADGRTYIGRSRTLTDANGHYNVPVRPKSQLLVAAVLQAQSETVLADIESGDVNIDECLVLSSSAATARLTWGADPQDLDTHFFGPDGSSTGEFEIYFDNKVVTVGSTHYDLDVDDVNSFGPEILTLPEFEFPGTYRYVVNLYSGVGTIPASPARVEVNLKGNIQVFSAAGAKGESSLEKWHVFNLIVDDALNVKIQPVQRLSGSYAADMSTRGGFAPAAAGLPEFKREKYYTEPVSEAGSTGKLAD